MHQAPCQGWGYSDWQGMGMALGEFSLEEQVDSNDSLVHATGGPGVYRLLWKLRIVAPWLSWSGEQKPGKASLR